MFQAYEREYPQKIWRDIWYNTLVPPFLDPEIPIDLGLPSGYVNIASKHHRRNI